MLLPIKGTILLLLLGAMAAGVYYRDYEQLPLPTTDDQRIRTELAQRWAQKVSLEVKRLPGRPRVAVANVVNDERGILTDQLKQWIGRRNVVMEHNRWYSRIGYGLGASAEPQSIEEACQPMLGCSIDYIVAAEVATWITYPEFEASLAGHVEIRDGRTGKTIAEFQLSLPQILEVIESTTEAKSLDHVVSRTDDAAESSSRSFMNPDRSQFDVVAPTSAGVQTMTAGPASSSWHQSALDQPALRNFGWAGFATWLCFVISVPLTGANRIKRLLRRQNNQTNGRLMLAWAIMAAVMACLLWGHWLPLEPAILLSTLATAAAAMYFGLVCHYLEKAT